MPVLRHRFTQVTSLLAAVLFLWLGAMHGAARIDAATSPEAFGYSIAEICGGEGSAKSTQHCPQCVVAEFAAYAPEITLPKPVQLTVLISVLERGTPRAAMPNWLRSPARAPPILT